MRHHVPALNSCLLPNNEHTFDLVQENTFELGKNRNKTNNIVSDTLLYEKEDLLKNSG